jgi:hypothetical protein
MAILQTEIAQRVKKLFGNPATLSASDARAKLVAQAKEKDVTKAGLDAWSEVLAGEVDKYVSSQDLTPALVATLMLKELESAKTVDTLLTALKSTHRAVRFAAVEGLQAIRPKLKDDEGAIANVLASLGKAGADEKDELVLRQIYESLNLKSVGAAAKSNDNAAAAMSEIFAARLRQLNGGSHDEYRDEDGYTAAVNCYAGASAENQAALVGAMYAFLRLSVNHYFDADVAAEALPGMGRRIGRLEKAIHDMISASKGTPPSKSVADKLKGGDRKQEKDAKAALDELHTVLKGDPWKLP